MGSDRLGPYAPADVRYYTVKGAIRTALRIGGWTNEIWILTVLIVPIPIKVRLTLARMRELGRVIAEGLGATFTEFNGTVILNCRYQLGTAYRETAFGFGMSDGGLYTLQCQLVLSRYVGLIELSSRDGPLLDVILDATDTAANPAVLACVQRAAVDQRSISERRERFVDRHGS